MSISNKKEISLIPLLILAGLVFGISSVILLGLYCNRQDPYSITRGNPQRFGNIELQSLSLDKESSMLLITKEKKPFIAIEKNDSGKALNMGLLDESGKNIRLSLRFSGKTGEVENLNYCKDVNGVTIGYKWTDINFDGQFDFKAFRDENGKVIDQFIVFNNRWLKVDKVGKDIAYIKDVIYKFSHETGLWTIQDYPGKEKFKINDRDNDRSE